MVTVAETPESGPGTLVLATDIPGADPVTVLSHFTDANLVVSWWAPESEVDLEAGSYTHRWPEMGWSLGGRILEHVPGHLLRFTWEWEHEPEAAMRTVTVRAERTAAGTRLTLTHGDYGPDDEESAARAGHLEGWAFFLPQLVAQVSRT